MLNLRITVKPADVLGPSTDEFNTSVDEAPEVRATAQNAVSSAGDALLTADSFGKLSLPVDLKALGIRRIGEAAIKGEIPDVLVHLPKKSDAD